MALPGKAARNDCWGRVPTEVTVSLRTRFAMSDADTPYGALGVAARKPGYPPLVVQRSRSAVPSTEIRHVVPGAMPRPTAPVRFILLVVLRTRCAARYGTDSDGLAPGRMKPAELVVGLPPLALCLRVCLRGRHRAVQSKMQLQQVLAGR
eukprot:3018885-Rhodomonas_salina.2